MSETFDDAYYVSEKDENSTNPLLDGENTFVTRRKEPRNYLFWATYTTILIVLLGAFSYIALLWHRSVNLENPQTPRDVNTKLTCGNSTAEALRLGCVLDVMVYSYTPPACLNTTHALEFFHSKPWEFWQDEQKTLPIPREDILAGKYDEFYSLWSFHGAHCQYLLTRNLQVLPTGSPLVEYMLDREHNTHCFEEVRQPSDPRRTLMVGITYSYCIIRNTEI